MKTFKRNWQNIPKQTLFGFGDNGQCGDCFRCCIAAIIGEKAENVPHFVQIAHDTGRNDISLAQNWLNERGFWIAKLDAPLVWERINLSFMRDHASNMPLMPFIACGPTIRSKSSINTHCVVMEEEQIVYDPHPKESGLLAINEIYLIIPFLKNINN